MNNGTKKKKLWAIIIGIIVLGGGGFAGWYFFWPSSPTDDITPKSIPIQFNELYYQASDVDNEWVELYYYGNETLSILNWQLRILTADGTSTLITLPDVDLIEYDYLAIHFGIANNWEDKDTIIDENHSKHIYLEQSQEILDNNNGGIELITNENQLVDSMGWGNSQISNLQSWTLVNTSLSAQNLESLAIWGYNDENSSANWFSTVATPGQPNAFELAVEDTDLALYIENGWINFERGNESYLVGKEVQKNGHPTKKTLKDEIKEYGDYSIKLYKKLGYGYPETNGDNKVNIKFSRSKKNNESCGSCDPDTGDITIEVGKMKSKISLKYCVEHEMFHAIQVKHKGGTGTAHETQKPEWWWDEGMAVWFGMLSTMQNFNKSMVEVMDEFKRVNDHNWHDHATTLNGAYFDKWHGGYNQYIGNFFLIKYLMEQYGEDIVKKIHDTIEQYKNGTQKVTAKEAIEKVLGKPFAEVLRDMYEWRIMIAPGTNGAPVVTPDVKLVQKDKPVSDTITVKPTGAALEEIDCSDKGQTFNITFECDKKMKIVVLKYKKNGDVHREEYEYDPSKKNDPIPINPTEFEKVQILKFNPDLKNTATIKMKTTIDIILKNVTFSEVNYLEDLIYKDYVEFYVWNNNTMQMKDWMLHNIQSGNSLPLPQVDIEAGDYVCFHFADPLEVDYENDTYSKHLFLGPDPIFLDDMIGDLQLLDENGTVVDQMLYGDRLPAEIEAIGWNSSFPAPQSTNPMYSISLWGEDRDSGQNWFESMPTPGLPNVYEFEIPDLITSEGDPYIVALHNGYYQEDFALEDPSMLGYRFAYEGPSIRIHTPPSWWRTRNRFREYTEFTLTLYKEYFGEEGDPATGADGKVDIHIGRTGRSETTGSTDANGTIYINIGQTWSPVNMKYTCEHELMHTLQVKRYANGNYSHECEYDEWWVDEGFATYFGIYSTMKNYNLTMREVLDELERTGCHNDRDHYTTMNISLFQNWTRRYDHYIGSFMFIKFLNETYGNNSLRNIYDNITRYWNGSQSIGAKEAIETVIGISLEQVIRRFYEWRLMNATRDNKIVKYTSDLQFNYTGTGFNDTVNVAPTGAVVQEITVSNQTIFELDFEVDEPMIITVVLFYNDGTNETFWFKVYPSGSAAPIPIDPNRVAKVQVIKQNPGTESEAEVTMKVTPQETSPEDPQEGTFLNPFVVPLDTWFWGFLPWYPDWFFDGISTSLWLNVSLGDIGTFEFQLEQNNPELLGGSWTIFFMSLYDWNGVDLIEISSPTPNSFEYFNELIGKSFLIKIESQGSPGYFGFQYENLAG